MTNQAMIQNANGVARRACNPLGSAALCSTVLVFGSMALACNNADDVAGQQRAGTTGAGTGGASGDQAAGAGGKNVASGAARDAVETDTGAGGSVDVGGAAGGGVVAGTGGVGAGGTGGPGGTGGVAGTDTVVVCSPIVAGQSTVSANGTTRTFSVQLPTDTSNMALFFLWHGFGQKPATFANEVVYDVKAGKWVPFDPNAFPMPLMIVTPISTNQLPPVGLDWDIGNGKIDFPFFDAMLQCINEQFKIDKTRIYSFGFSAGAVFTNLLSAKYPHLFAATISESGTWFNDMAQWADVLIPAMQWDWPAFDPADQGNVLLTHGGPSDFATIISLESANKKAVPYLYKNGRTVTECTHTFGHTLAPDLSQAMYYDFMWAHRLGEPPITGMIPSFPTPAKPVGATSCIFHPAP